MASTTGRLGTLFFQTAFWAHQRPQQTYKKIHIYDRGEWWDLRGIIDYTSEILTQAPASSYNTAHLKTNTSRKVWIAAAQGRKDTDFLRRV